MDSVMHLPIFLVIMDVIIFYWIKNLPEKQLKAMTSFFPLSNLVTFQECVTWNKCKIAKTYCPHSLIHFSLFPASTVYIWTLFPLSQFYQVGSLFYFCLELFPLQQIYMNGLPREEWSQAKDHYQQIRIVNAGFKHAT